jgi:hypothetical protein
VPAARPRRRTSTGRTALITLRNHLIRRATPSDPRRGLPSISEVRSPNVSRGPGVGDAPITFASSPVRFASIACIAAMLASNCSSDMADTAGMLDLHQ